MAKPDEGSGRGLTPKAKPGPAPFAWTAEIEGEIFDRIAKGEAVAAICTKDDWLPGQTTFYKRLQEDDAFAKRYLRAREVQAHNIFEECLAIADSQEGDILEDGTVNHDVIQRAKLRIDTRMRMAGKLSPKVYGDKSAIEVTGKDGGPIKAVTIGMTAQEAAEAYAATLASGAGGK